MRGRGGARCFSFLNGDGVSKELLRQGSSLEQRETYVSMIDVSALCKNGDHMCPHVVIYRSEDLLGRNQKTRHLPDGHLEVHLGEFEQPEGYHSSVLGVRSYFKA